MLPDGHLGHFIEVNDIACQRLGYTRAELLRLRPDDIGAPGQGRAGDAQFLRRLAEHRHVIFERVHVAKEGRHIPVEINAHLFTLGDKEAILGVARDVTERKLAEQALRATCWRRGCANAPPTCKRRTPHWWRKSAIRKLW